MICVRIDVYIYIYASFFTRVCIVGGIGPLAMQVMALTVYTSGGLFVHCDSREQPLAIAFACHSDCRKQAQHIAHELFDAWGAVEVPITLPASYRFWALAESICISYPSVLQEISHLCFAVEGYSGSQEVSEAKLDLQKAPEI